MQGQVVNLSTPQHPRCQERQRRRVGGIGSSSTSRTNLIWFQLSHLSGTWRFDFCVNVIVVILFRV